MAWIRGTVIHPLSPGRWGLSPRTCLFTSSHRPPQRSLFTIYLNFVHFIFWSDLLVSLTRDPTIYYTVKPHCSSSAVYIDLPERGSRICWAYRKYSWICNIFPHHGVFSGSAEETDHCSCWHRGFYRWETFKAGGLIMVGWYVECVCVSVWKGRGALNKNCQDSNLYVVFLGRWGGNGIFYYIHRECRI